MSAIAVRVPVERPELPRWRRGPRARAAGVVALGAFAVLVIGGYHWGWTWTGFTGNTSATGSI